MHSFRHINRNEGICEEIITLAGSVFLAALNFLTAGLYLADRMNRLLYLRASCCAACSASCQASNSPKPFPRS